MTDTNKMRKLLAAATPPPWYGTWGISTADGDPIASTDVSLASDPEESHANGDLIVAAVNGLPAMLDELDAARAEVAAVEAAICDRGVSERDCSLPLAKRVDNLIVDLRTWSLSYAQTVMENEQLRAEVERLRAQLREVAASGVETECRQYVTVQIDPETWRKIQEVPRG